MAQSATSKRRLSNRSVGRLGMFGLVVTLVLAGCSGDDGKKAANADAAVVVDQGPRNDSSRAEPDAQLDANLLATCATPGAACEATDPCAIETQCGDDGLCRAVRLQDCDDELACTRDICLGRGLCDHEVNFGSCLIPATPSRPAACVVEEQTNPDNPCQRCRPHASRSGWTDVSGLSCDDGDPCTDDDRCRQGRCRGDYFGHECADRFDCTVDTCLTPAERSDPKIRCDLNKPIREGWCKALDVFAQDLGCFPAGDVSDDGCWVCDPATNKTQLTDLRSDPGTYCTVNGKCYADDSTDPSGCWRCDVNKSTNSLVRVEGGCEIGGRCFDAGSRNGGGCASCDVAEDPYHWTVDATKCLIGGVCYQDGEQDQWCRICDAEQSPDAWTLVTGACFIDGKCRTVGEPSRSEPSCGVCDPGANPNAWSPASGKCLIDGKCYDQGRPATVGACAGCAADQESRTEWQIDTNWCLIDGVCVSEFENVHATNGCLTCGPGSRHEWQDQLGVSKQSFDFEAGALPDGWSASSSQKAVTWQVSSRRADGSRYALYYGDPARGSFDSGTKNSGRVTLPPMTLTKNRGALLRFRLWVDIGKSFGALRVFNVLGGITDQVWHDHRVKLEENQRRWQTILVRLNRFRFSGEVQLAFDFDSVSERNNLGEGIFIDDVQVYQNCL